MIKRSTFLARRKDITQDQFAAHWRGHHADIAARFSGLAGYNQNHVMARLLEPARSPGYFLDGIVELWFADETGAGAGRDPDVTEDLVADEPRFLGGLSGSNVSPSDLYPPSTYKIWALGRWREGSHPTELEATAARLRSVLPAAGSIMVQISDPSTPFTREGLEVDAAPPEAAVIVCFDDALPSVDDRHRIVREMTSSQTALDQVAVVLAREERIV